MDGQDPERAKVDSEPKVSKSFEQRLTKTLQLNQTTEKISNMRSIIPTKQSGNSREEIPTIQSESNYGFLHKIFTKLCPKSPNTAVVLFIIVSMLLSSSDTVSDIGLAYFLFTR